MALKAKMIQTQNKVPYDAYYLMTVKWKGGITHSILCRGFNLKSWLDFQKSITWVDSYSYEEITKEEHDKRFYGVENEPIKKQRKKK